MNKDVGIHTHTHIYNGILPSYKRKWNNAICSNIDSPRDYHHKWRKPDREKWVSYDTTCMWNIKIMV